MQPTKNGRVLSLPGVAGGGGGGVREPEINLGHIPLRCHHWVYTCTVGRIGGARIIPFENLRTEGDSLSCNI